MEDSSVRLVHAETPQSPYVNERVRFDASNSLLGWNGTHDVSIIEYYMHAPIKAIIMDPVIDSKGEILVK